MKTQNNTLDFRKESVVELNDETMKTVSGGIVSLIVTFSLF